MSARPSCFGLSSLLGRWGSEDPQLSLLRQAHSCPARLGNALQSIAWTKEARHCFSRPGLARPLSTLAQVQHKSNSSRPGPWQLSTLTQAQHKKQQLQPCLRCRNVWMKSTPLMGNSCDITETDVSKFELHDNDSMVLGNESLLSNLLSMIGIDSAGGGVLVSNCLWSCKIPMGGSQ